MPELGTKYECFSCGAKFYDLGRPEPICPKCGANQKDKKLESHAESTHARKRRREEVVRVPDETDDSAPSGGDDDFSDEEIEVPEGLDDAEEEEEADDD